MANGYMPGQTFQVFLAERIGHKTNVGEVTERPSIGGGNAGTLLATVLQCIKPVERDLCGVTFGRLREIDTHDPTRVVRVIGLVGSDALSVIQKDTPRRFGSDRTLPL